MISKQTFLVALGCDTAGWYQARAVREVPGPGLEWQFYTGNEIGKLARSRLGPGTLLPFAPTEMAVRATTNAMEDPDSTLLFEATFVAGSFVARADAARRSAAGWELIEVKSALTPDEGKTKDEHIDDFAYTTFVAIMSGVPIEHCTLMFLSRESRAGDLHFSELDVTAVVLARAAEFAERAPGIAAACAAVDRPLPVLQFVCRNCDFFATECVGKGVPDPLFLLPRLSEKRFDAMKQHQRISAVPADPDLTGPQHRVFRAVRSGTPVIDRSALARLQELEWPVYYLDFEAVAPALPWFDGGAPYDVMPFQFSIHVCDRPGHEIAHHEYLAPIGGDWRHQLAVVLIDRLGTRGSITMYTDYEQKRLESMARALPEFEAELNAIIARLVDLEPIVRHGYCHPGFLGRTSIKNVLPVVAPDLRYATTGVGNGLDAEGLFALMTVGRRTPDEHAAFREQLLEYCKLDTLAMVRLHGALEALSRDLLILG